VRAFVHKQFRGLSARHNDGVIDVPQATKLAQLLRDAGQGWEPAPGDRFTIPGRDLDQVFVIADMTIEVQQLPTGRLIRFNGTTEWALDSIEAEEVVWLPWEHQLRSLLGAQFTSLESLPPPAQGYAVTLSDGSRHVETQADLAYLRALLSLLGSTA
jgi:hypothetical protein